MSLDERVAVFADGNMGAASVVLMLADLSEDYFLVLDDLDVAGGDLYLVFNDVCGRNIEHLGVLLVATRAGVLDLNREKLIYAANNRGSGIDLAAVLAYIGEVGMKARHLF
jgi:hypothetical protein